MSDSTITAMASAVGERADVQRWVRRLQKLAATMPPDVWVFVASGTPTVLAKDERGGRIETRDGSVHRGAIIASARGGTWDGGDW